MANFLSNLFSRGASSKIPTVGLDISSHSIRFVELVPGKGGYALGVYGKRNTPSGMTDSGEIKDVDGLKEILRSFRSKYRFSNVNVSTPGGKTHFIRMTLPKVAEMNVRSGVEKRIQEHFVPVNSGGFVFDYIIISENDAEYDIEVSIFPLGVSEEYSTMFEGTGLTPSSFEPEERAIVRAVLPHGDKGTRMIIDFGKVQTGASVVSRGAVMFTATLGMGEHSVVQAIRDSLNISEEEAIKMKSAYGLGNGSNDEEFFRALLRPLSALKDEIDKLFVYWHNHFGDSDDGWEKIESIILLGGVADIPGLSDYLSSNLKVPVVVANVWANVNSFDEYIPEIPLGDSLHYAAAIGLALRGVYEKE